MASSDAATVQTVKLKILYTFDNESKDNHLARWPQPVPVTTAFIDVANQVGIIDLRTCLEAVTIASPELSSQLDTDYTVYSYDYSEEDIPLTGHGMLSHRMMEIMGQETEIMVTGRIVKGLMGILNKNAQPTLEVKLRLKPLSTSTTRQRSGSVSSQDGRPAWLQSDNALQRIASPMDTSGLETMQRMLSESGLPRSDMYGQSRPGSRAGTPVFQQQYNQPQFPNSEDFARPSSRATMYQPMHNRRDSFSGYYSGEEMTAEEPSRKRAKTTKLNQSQVSKNSFNIEQQTQDLRAAAGKANSLRLHRPTPIHPSGLPGNLFANEEPVRPPTPVPTKRPRGRPRNADRKPLPRMNPAVVNARTIVAKQQAIPRLETLDSQMSPEDVRARSVSSTPANIPSSPPIMPSMAARTSPALPPMRDVDSGIGSSNMDEEIFGDHGMMNFDGYDFGKDGGMSLDIDFEQFTEKQYPPVFDDMQDTPMLTNPLQDPEHDSNVENPSPTIEPAEGLAPPQQNQPASQSLSPNTSAPNDTISPQPDAAPSIELSQADAPKEPKKTRAPNKRTMSTIPASDPVGPSLQRSQTWAPGSDQPMSDAPTAQQDSNATKAKTRKRVGKEQTKARLVNAIAAGEMPPFCDNCGAIETPAWRRGFVKVFDASETPFGPIAVGLGPNEIVYKEAEAYNEDKSIKTWKGYKVDTNTDDIADGWVQVQLCNPCGLWFNKQKCPRPKEKWEKVAKPRRRRGKGVKGPKKQPNPKSDAQTPASDGSSPADTSTEAPDDNDDVDDGMTDANEPELPSMPRQMRARSLDPGMAARASKAALAERQVQSSPTRGAEHGMDHPDTDLTPKPVRRQLFPSPNKTQSAPASTHGTAKLQAGGLQPSWVRRSPRLTRTKDVFQVPGLAGAIALTIDGKENLMPEIAVADTTMSMDEFFDMSMAEEMPPPATPQRPSERLQSKTPQRAFGIQISGNASRSPQLHTPKTKQPVNGLERAFLGTVAKNPEDLTPLSRGIHDAVHGDMFHHQMATLTPNRLRKTPKKSSGEKMLMFDFPDLPSLKNSSPSNSDDDLLFSVPFSELPTDILQTDASLFSTDGAMPSSPPPRYSAMDFDAQPFEDWGQLQEEHGVKSSYMDFDHNGSDDITATPRRSPRNRD